MAAVQKGSTAGYGGDALPEISFTMNLLPFLAGGQQVVADALASLGPASHRILGVNWAKVYRPAYGKIKKIVYWRPNGVYGGEITPAAAVRVIEQAFRLSGITVEGAAPAVANINDKGAQTMDERDKGDQQPGPGDLKPSTDKISLTLSDDTVLSPLSASERLEVWQFALPLDSPATRAVLRKRRAGARPGTGKLVITAGDAEGGTLYYKGRGVEVGAKSARATGRRSCQLADGRNSWLMISSPSGLGQRSCECGLLRDMLRDISAQTVRLAHCAAGVLATVILFVVIFFSGVLACSDVWS